MRRLAINLKYHFVTNDYSTTAVCVMGFGVFATNIVCNPSGMHGRLNKRIFATRWAQDMGPNLDDTELYLPSLESVAGQAAISQGPAINFLRLTHSRMGVPPPQPPDCSRRSALLQWRYRHNQLRRQHGAPTPWRLQPREWLTP